MTCNKTREKPARKQVQVIEGWELRKKLVAWQPASRKIREWFNREVDQVLESVLVGGKMKVMSSLIWNMGEEAFRTEQGQTRVLQHVRENRCSREIA